MNVIATMNPVANYDLFSVSVEDHVEPTYNLSAVDPLALMIWWSKDDQAWSNEPFPPDNSVIVQRLVTIATEGVDGFEKLIPGIVRSLPDKYVAEAKKVREYYVNKFVQIGIRGEGPISKTRGAMYRVLTDTSKLELRDLALMSRIHDFYLEDQFVDQLVENAVSVDQNQFPQAHTVNQVYTVVGNNRRITKQVKLNVWWLRGDDGTLLILTSPTHLTTNSLVENFLTPGRRWHIRSSTCAVRAIMGHRDFNTRVLTHGYTLDEAPDSA